jgi:hypothetical protein
MHDRAAGHRDSPLHATRAAKPTGDDAASDRPHAWSSDVVLPPGERTAGTGSRSVRGGPADPKPSGFHLLIGVFAWPAASRSRKRAVIRTASFARTLYTICTCTPPCIDPQ